MRLTDADSKKVLKDMQKMCVKDFCKKYGIAYRTFYEWKCKLELKGLNVKTEYAIRPKKRTMIREYFRKHPDKTVRQVSRDLGQIISTVEGALTNVEKPKRRMPAYQYFVNVLLNDKMQLFNSLMAREKMREADYNVDMNQLLRRVCNEQKKYTIIYNRRRIFGNPVAIAKFKKMMGVEI